MRSAMFLWVTVLVLLQKCWKDADAHPTGDVTSCPVLERSEWGAEPPVIGPLNMTLPVPFVVIHHSYIPSACDTRETCSKAMRTMQHMHQIANKWNDIGYNFAIGSDGQVYEGRGWDVVGAHAPKYNFMSIGICFIGDYRTEAPSAPMLEAAQRLILCGIDRGSIDTNYTLVGHKQVRETECPGGALFQVIQQWLHWKPIRDIQPRISQRHKPPPNDTTADQSARDKPAPATNTNQSAPNNNPAYTNITDQSERDRDIKHTTDQPVGDTNDTPTLSHNTDQSAFGDSVASLPQSTKDQSELDSGTKTTLSPSNISTASSRDPPFLVESDTTVTTKFANETRNIISNEEHSNTVDVSDSEITN